MHKSHNMGYAEYDKGIEQKLQVERAREKEYEESQRLIKELENKSHK